MKSNEKTSPVSTLSSKDDKYLFNSLMGQCFNVFIQAQMVWKYYAHKYSGPYDRIKGRQLQPENINSSWIKESCEPHVDLMKKTLQSIYGGFSDWQSMMDHGLNLFKWYSASRCRFWNHKTVWRIKNSDNKMVEVFHRFKDVNLDSRIEVAVNQARRKIFGRKPNSEEVLADGEIIACFAMHEALDSKLLLQSYPNVICEPPALREEELHVARSILELAKYGCDSKKSVLPETKSETSQQGGKNSKVKKEDVVRFPTTPGPKWPDVEITFINDDYVNIKVKKATKNKVHFSEIGFEYRETGKPIKLWKILRTFALHNGTIPPKVDKQGELKKIVLPDDVKRLRTKLCTNFKIDDNPISYIKGKWIKGNYIKAEGYKTVFHIKDESYLTK